MSRCKGCGETIQFIKTPAGKWEVGDKYNIYSRLSGGMIILQNGVVMKAENIEKSVKAFRPHWATCPAADKFKKKKESVDENG